jgi:acyl-coenzyme A synthetase/AMP-(fatty) acid ligase
MVYAFAGRQRALANLITAYGVTHISATATYYRNVLVELKDSYPSVKRVTFGGEPFDPRLAEQLKARFPHARMTNIYASTEAGTLFSGDGESFAVLPEMVSLIRIDEENDELLLHRSLLGDSQTFVTEQDWFRTGDLVERLPDGRFRFKARQSEMINIGGYKVNPGEVEQLLRTVPGVLDVRVSGVANKVTGHILLAEVVKGADIDDLSLKIRIKQYAAEHLQAWKVPRIIEIVPELRVSRTGKKART